MKNKNYLRNDFGIYKKSLWAFALLVCLSVTNINAQVATYYTFSQSNGIYTPVTGGTVIAAANGVTTSNVNSLDQGVFSGNIGFTFNFNGINYTTFNAHANGYITFGATLPGVTLSTPISSTTAYEGAVSALARDLWGLYGSVGTRTLGSPVITGVTDFTGIAVGKPIRGTGIPTTPATITAFNIGAGTITMSANATSTSTNTYIGWPVGEIRVETIGSAPTRICVIQFSGMSDFSTTAPTGNMMAWQIRLSEGAGVIADQSIEIVYGPMTNLSTTSRTQQVGLRGATNSDFNNRTSTSTWSGTTAGATNSATVARTNTNFPASGLTFTWTPPSGCFGTPTAGTASTNLTNVCIGTSSTLTLSGYPQGIPGITLQWQQSSSPGGPYVNVSGGTGATTAVYSTPSLTNNTYYVCKVTCTNSAQSALSNEIAITVTNPLITGTTPASRCGIGTVTLVAASSPGTTIHWYDSQAASTPVATGNSFTTPVISSTTDYWVAAVSGAANGIAGRVNPFATSTGFNGNDYGLVFDVTQPFTLVSVDVYPTTASGSVTVQLENSAGTVIQTAGPFTMPAATGTTFAGGASPVTLTLNFNIPAGTSYRLQMASQSGSLIRDNPISSQFSYPLPIGSFGNMTSGLLAGSPNANTYYYFYNWQFLGGCEGLRQPVTATVTPPPALSIAATALTICPGGTSDITVSSSNDPNYTYTWTSDPAGFNVTGSGPHTVSPSVTTTYHVTAADNSAGPNQGCVNIGSITITNPGLATGTIVSSLTDICISGNPVLSAPGALGTSFQWQQSTTSASGPWANVGTDSKTYDPGTLTQTTYFQLIASCGLQSETSNVVTVTVNNPQITNTTTASRCGAGTVTLGAEASPGATINWYASALGGASLGTGISFVTPFITSTTDFYAGASNGFSQQSATVGYTNTAGYDFLTQTNGWGLMFTAHMACTLDSVAVFPEGTGTISIEILTPSNTVLYTGPTVNVSGTGTQKVFVPVGAVLAPGNYKIGQNTTGVTNLGSQVTGSTMAYPFPSALATITSGTQGSGAVAAVYYWFYDLSFSASIGCEGVRVPVTAMVTPSPAINVTTADADVCISGTSSVSVSSSNDPNYTYTWTSTPAGFSATGPGPHSVTADATRSYDVYAVDNTAGPFAGCGAVGSVTVNAIPNQIALNPTATPSSVCPHGNAQLSAGASIPGYIMNTSCNTSFIDISSTGVSIGTITDDSEHNITIPPFTYNGVVYTNARVGMNGVIVFGASTGEITLTNASLPATTVAAGSAFLAPFWDDLDIQGGATVKTQTVGSTFIIQWTGATHNLFTTGAITFQVQMDLVTGVITFIYPDAIFGDADHDGGKTATVGIQFSTTSAVLYSFNTVSLSNGQCISFSPVVPNLTYDWSVNSTYLTATNIANPVAQDVTVSQTYTVTVQDVNTGCSRTQTLSLPVNPLPEPEATSNAPVCTGLALNLFANNLASGQSSGNTFAWSGPNSFSSTSQNPVIAATTVANDGVYSVTLTNANGCISSTTTIVNINVPPQIVSLQSATLNGGAATTFPSPPVFLDIPVFTEATSCDKVVNYNVNITGTPDPDEVIGGVTFTFTGATAGSGNGTGSGSAFGRAIPTGRTTVTINATNVCGSQSKQFRVTATDNVAPVITPNQVPVTNTNGGDCSSLVQVTQPSVGNGLFDNCPNVSLIFVSRSDSRTQFEPYYAGTTTVTWLATDASSNTSTATQDIVVNNIKPVITSFVSDAGSLIFVGQTATFTVEFTDEDGGGTHTVKYYRDKNDASPASTKVIGFNCTQGCTGVRSYIVTSDPILFSTSQVLEPKVEVLDGCNLAADQNPGVTTIMYLAIAVAGNQFTTAGGHFTMPAGGHPSSYEGYNVSIGNIVKKATTGNSFKGQLEMNVHIPNQTDWRVHTDNGTNNDITWDYLTIGGCSLATFKGSVRVNGQTGYKILVQQSDKDRNPATSNFIRVKVTTNSGTVIFDTQPGLTEALTSGNGGAAAITVALDNGAVKVQPSSTQNQACESRIEGSSLEDDVLQNVPNPFNGQTEIRFSVPENGTYTLKVYNYLGEEVKTLFSGEAATGSVYSVMFDGSNLGNGIYTYTLSGANMNETRRMNLIR